MQTRRQSVIEVCTNTAVGMAGSWLITYVTMTLVKDIPVAAAITVAGCTIWSLVRGYYVRRRFAALEARQ